MGEYFYYLAKNKNPMNKITLSFIMMFVFALGAFAQPKTELIQARIINGNCKVNYSKVTSEDGQEHFEVTLAFISTRNLWFTLTLDTPEKFRRFNNDLLNRTRETTNEDKSAYLSETRKDYYISKNMKTDNVEIMLLANQERWILMKEVAKELSLYVNSIPYGEMK
jgi:type 1 fimbria pilin